MTPIYKSDNIEVIRTPDGYGLRLLPMGTSYTEASSHELIDISREILRDNEMLHELGEGK